MTGFDVIVVGGGHAGIEAAWIAAKRDVSVLLITSHVDLIGQMSCNPAIGGIAKGNIVREVDALGGMMGRAIDQAGIHFKMLNRSKGMAVWGNRAQADKVRYRRVVRRMLERRSNLHLLQGMVRTVAARGARVSSVIMDSGEEIEAGAVVLAMGTFLNGVAHVGLESFPCGRGGEPPSTGLTESIAALGIESGRLKTGTSPRIDGRSVDYAQLEEQKGDEEPWAFSYATRRIPSNRVSCWVGRSTEETHEIIRDNLDRSPLYTGKIKTIGPRYCPSIEDKVVRFGDRQGHTLFLEPEGLDLREMYLNGLSTSLPFDVQAKMVQSIRGFRNARILRPGYGIEYDFFPPQQLHLTLESKVVQGLFFAGQINGTSGYEEAACQGLVAGLNAAESVAGGSALVLGRDTSYTGVLIDDLVTKGTQEPYRMFTSRAEYRLMLRQDNADERLMPLAAQRGLIEPRVYASRRKHWEAKADVRQWLGGIRITPQQWESMGKSSPLRTTTNAAELLCRPETTLSDIERMTGECVEGREKKLGVEADIKYSGFVEKQRREIQRLRKMENTLIPEDLDYAAVEGLLNESRAKLSQLRPRSIGQASRIPGITPADISILTMHIVRKSGNAVSRETTVDDV